MCLDFARIVENEQQLEIDLLHLGYKTHHFEYVLNADFIASFEQDIIENANVKVNVELEKGEALVKVKFSFEGVAQLICDRSLEIFDYVLNFKKEIFLKYGEGAMELDDNLIQLDQVKPIFNIGHIMFELLILDIPKKRIHPDYRDKSDEDAEVKLYFSTGEEEEIEQKEETLDPRWKELLKLKNKN